MSTEIGYKDFQKLMADFASEYLNPVTEAYKSGIKLERKTDKSFAAVFQGFTEISATLETLALTETLVGAAPPRSRNVNRDDYLKFLIGAYLQEMYILEQRLSAYASKVSRLYGNRDLPALVKQLVYEPMKGVINTRGSHVHSQRYSDQRLDMVATMALFRRVGHELGEDMEIEYKFAQRHWKEQIQKNNAETLKIVDRYFAVIGAIICLEGKLSFPAQK